MLSQADLRNETHSIALTDLPFSFGTLGDIAKSLEQ